MSSTASLGQLAVLIDYENLAPGLGGQKGKGQLPDVKRIFERLVGKGRIVVKRAYCDWQRFSAATTPLHELGVELIEIPVRASTGKNSADIRLAVDAVEMCLTKEHVDTFVILSGDSDFSPLVSKLKEYGKTVIGVGRRESTSALLAEVCDEFIFYEEIAASSKIPSFESKVPKEKRACYKLLLETIDAAQGESDGAILASLLKGLMLRKQPQFSERSYGYSKFSNLLREAAGLGLIEVRQDPRSGTVMVDGICE